MKETTEQLLEQLKVAESTDNPIEELQPKTEILHKLADAYLEEKNYEQATDYVGQAIATFKQEQPDADLKEKIIGTAAKIYSNIENFEQGKEQFLQMTEALPIESAEQAKAFFHSAYFFLSAQHFEEAENYCTRAARIYEGLQDKYEQANCMHALANVYAFQKKYNEAVEYYEKAAELFEAAGKINHASKCFLNMRILYKQASTPKSLIKYCKKQVKKYSKSPLKAFYLQEIALGYNAYDNKKNEQKYLIKAIEAKEDAGIAAELGLAYSMTADYFDNKEDDEKALKNYLQAAKLMLENDEYEHLGPVINFLQHSDDEMNDEQKGLFSRISEEIKSKNIELE